MSDDTINLKRLVRRVLVGTLLSALAAAVVGGTVWAVVRTQPAVYESKALIRMPVPAMYTNHNIAPIGVLPPTPDRKAMSHLLKSQAVLEQTFQSPELQPYVGEDGRFFYAMSLMEVISDRENLLLRVTGPDPELVAVLTNAWAAVAVDALRAEQGVPQDVMAMLRRRADEALAAWAQWHERVESSDATGFEAAKLEADAEASRASYLAMTQAIAQAELYRAAAREGVTIGAPARARNTPVHPRPRRYASAAALLVFSVGLFLVLVVELTALER